MTKLGRPRNPRLESTRELYKFIKRYIALNGYPPTIHEMMDDTGITTTSHIHWLLNRLEEEGKIRREPGKARAIQIQE